MSIFKQARPNGNGQTNALKPRNFDGNICKCGRLLPARYYDKDGFVQRVASRVCDNCDAKVGVK